MEENKIVTQEKKMKQQLRASGSSRQRTGRIYNNLLSQREMF